jgi:Domain of unknown function (DUF4276)
MKPKRLVLFVEGEGEAEAAPRLVKRIISEQSGWDAVRLEPQPYRVGHLNRLRKDEFSQWLRFLAASKKGGNLGAVLLLLDGDTKRKGQKFCAAEEALVLADKAMSAGAGTIFSVAVVFAMQEFESWFIAGFSSLLGKRLPDGRRFLDSVQVPENDLEVSPRDAKGWLNGAIKDGYKQTRDQADIVDLVNLQAIRDRKMRSFRRFEAAVSRLATAIRSEKPIVDPVRPVDSPHP